MIDELKAVGKHHEAPEGAVTTAVLDFELAMRYLQAAKMDSIAEHFEDLLWFDKYTTGNLETFTI